MQVGIERGRVEEGVSEGGRGKTRERVKEGGGREGGREKVKEGELRPQGGNEWKKDGWRGGLKEGGG